MLGIKIRMQDIFNSSNKAFTTIYKSYINNKNIYLEGL